MATVAAFNGVGSGWQEGIVKERQGFLQVGGKELLQRLADGLESADASAKSREFFQGRLSAAPTVEEAICLVHDIAQGAKLGLAASDPREGALLGRSQVMGHKEMTMCKEVCDLLLESFLAAGLELLRLRPGTTTGQLRHLRLQPLAHLGHGLEHGFRELREDVEFTDLMRYGTKDFRDRDRIKRRAVGGDALEFPVAGGKGFLEPSEESHDVGMLGIVVEHFIGEALESPIVDDRKHAKGAVVQFVRGNIPGEARQDLIKVFGRDVRFSLFSPPPRPSSGWWRRERRLGDRATNARRPPGKAGRPPRPAGPPGPPPGGCSGISAARDRPCRR